MTQWEKVLAYVESKHRRRSNKCEWKVTNHVALFLHYDEVWSLTGSVANIAMERIKPRLFESMEKAVRRTKWEILKNLRKRRSRARRARKALQGRAR